MVQHAFLRSSVSDFLARNVTASPGTLLSDLVMNGFENCGEF